MSLIIKKCYGYELEKEKKNTSEDFFNRSEVTFVENGKEKTLHVLYVRYFDEKFSELTPFTEDPVLTIGEKQYEFKDIVALACLMKNKALRKRKRVYISSENEFADYFKDVPVEQIFDVLRGLEEKGSFQLKSV